MTKRAWSSLMAAAIFLSCAAYLPAQDSYGQPWRPQYHFTPPRNFMNDPNGMVFYKGEHHLFYQYNPQGNVWGHMSWGHAISTDMVHWRNLPVAIPEDPKYMAYSGSAVVDWNNSSGLCSNPDPQERSCLIAIYAAAYKDRQKQHIAFSNDRGRTWTNYSGNPVIDLDASDFRDPKVFWYEPHKKWVMVAVLADERKAVFLESSDLKKWTLSSRFGPAGDDAGQWECPDLLELPIQGTGEKKWVLIINRNPGAPAGGTGVRYLVGNFDGKHFTDETPPQTKLWADYGKDFYATNSFNDMPASDGRRIWMGWISNWLYAKDEPTVLWRGAQSVPRTLALRRTPAGIILVQTPIAELEGLRRGPFQVQNASIHDANRKMREAAVKGETYEIVAEFDTQNAGEIGFRLRTGDDAETVVGVVPSTNTLFVDRRHSGNVSFSKDFPGRFSTTLESSKSIKLHIFVDSSSIEVFANDGEKVLTGRIYPPPGSTGIELYSRDSGGRVGSLKIWQLESIWKPQ